MADDAAPYGIAANRPAIELLMRYAAEQGLIPRAYGVDELFVGQILTVRSRRWQTFPA